MLNAICTPVCAGKFKSLSTLHGKNSKKKFSIIEFKTYFRSLITSILTLGNLIADIVNLQKKNKISLINRRTYTEGNISPQCTLYLFDIETEICHMMLMTLLQLVYSWYLPIVHPTVVLSMCQLQMLMIVWNWHLTWNFKSWKIILTYEWYGRFRLTNSNSFCDNFGLDAWLLMACWSSVREMVKTALV